MAKHMSHKEFAALQKRMAAEGKPLRIVGGIDHVEPQPAPEPLISPTLAQSMARTKSTKLKVERITPQASFSRPSRAMGRIAPMLAPSQRQLWHTHLLARLAAFGAICVFPYGVVLLAIWLYVSR